MRGGECAAPPARPGRRVLGQGAKDRAGFSRLTSGPMGLFTGPHLCTKAVSTLDRRAVASRGRAAYQMSCSEVSSFTMRLSSGDRPVLAPE